MSRFWKYFWVTLYCVVLAASPVFANLIGDLDRLGLDMTGDPVKLQGTLDFYINSGYVDMAEISKPASPATNRGKLYVKDVASTTSLMFLDSAGTETNLLTAGSGGTLDQAYDQGGAGAGKAITVDSGAIALSNTDADNAWLLTLNGSPSGAAALGGLQVTIGANSTQDALEFVNGGSGYDIYGTSGTWTVSKAGAAVFSSLSPGTFSTTGVTTLGNNTNTVAVNSSSWDVTTAGAFSGVTTLSMSGNLTNTGGDIILANGKAVKGSTTTAETVKMKVYDNDTGPAYVDAITLTNGNTPAIIIGSNNPTVAIDSPTWDVSTAGAFTGVADITGTAGEAMTITLASDGAADDLTISVTGATDSSVILASAGTGADAIKASASAGGVDIDAAAASDVTIDGGQVAIASKDDAASAISLTTNVGTSETIVVTNTQGTGESAITLAATAGGVNVDAAAAKDLDLAGGQVKLVSKDDAAGAISLTANVGTSETITVTNTQGTAAGAVALTATAGGVDVDAAATKDITLDGGQVAIGSKDDAASAISLTTNVGTSETITVTNTQGTDAAAIGLTATAGGITAAVASGKAITLNGTTNLKVGSDIASPAGGELTLGDGTYFNITGTNNITSIAAASATAGRLVILHFADALTFTDGNNLKLAGNLVTTADDLITLLCDGTNCYEMARSAN